MIKIADCGARSSNIQSIYYDEKKEMMEIVFKGKTRTTTYQYSGVPKKVVTDIIQTHQKPYFSYGRWVRTNIQNKRYSYKKVS